MPVIEKFDVIIIGAGPSGAIAAGILIQKGWKVLVIEREEFPRFSIGESLLPQCMAFIEEANMLDSVIEQADDLGFQFKNGAAFYRNGERSSFDFTKKFSNGPGTTFQVKRASFDKVLADRAEELGVDIRYKHNVTAVDFTDKAAIVSAENEKNSLKFEAKFILDASGFGRVLPKLLSLELPSTLSDRRSLFCHFEDGIIDTQFDRNKILITVHPEINDIWYWLIPFSDGTASCGVVGDVKYFDKSLTDEQIFNSFISQDAHLASILKQANKITSVRALQGYSSDVTKLFGDRFALLGNAGEFLDPVFSSGVTIAMYSSSLAANLLDKQLSGKVVSWQQEYAENLRAGVNVFKNFVMSWYDTELQNVIFFQKEDNDVKSMICSILAGYAWDQKNPYVSKTERRLAALVDICQQSDESK